MDAFSKENVRMDIKLADEYRRAEHIIDSSNCDVISFDLFNTLVYRPLFSNHDHLRLFASWVYSEYHLDIEKQRMSASLDMDNPCASLREIWEFIGYKHKLDPDLVYKLADEEFEFDLSFLRERTIGKKLYAYAVSKNKRVLIITDTYYASDQVRRILNKFGYQHVERVYTSCDCKAVKRTGSLFKNVLSIEKIPNSNCMLHIGDNESADYAGAKIGGIQAVLIPSDRKWFESRWNIIDKREISSVYDSAIWGAALHWLANQSFVNEDIDERISLFAAFVLFPLLIHLAITLHTNANVQDKNTYKCLDFVSRDGFLMKKAYDILANQYPNSLPSRYFYTSRIVGELLTAGDLENRLSQQSITSDCTLRQYIKIMILDNALRKKLMNELNVQTLNMRIKDNKSECEKALEQYSLDLCSAFDIQKQDAADYYNQMIEQSQRILLVDCGFCGTTSRLLTNWSCGKFLFDKFFLWEKDANALNDAMIGTKTYVLFTKKRGRCCAPMVEAFFSEPFGSCIGFRKNREGGLDPYFEDDWYPQEMRIMIEGVQSIALELVNIFKENYKGVLSILGITTMDSFFSAYSNFTNSEAVSLYSDIRFKESLSPQIAEDSLLDILQRKNREMEQEHD